MNEEKEQAETLIVYDTKYVKDLIEEIEAAAEEDQRLNQEGKPALHKLFLMDTIYNKLLNRKIHLELLDSGILGALRKWLEPLPNNSLPSDEVKKGIIDILQHFHPMKEHLIESGIGKIILFYSKNPYEKKPIKRAAKQLVLKWIEVAAERDD
ncbi:transcription factor SPN1 [Nematocida displodere]|uniref:Transcription factor SPN1 n=1 Tax=Nematocida displodere TaxID=1805483 RepID=A0A177EAX1_9MICR|nr:transcription factor SPN1 [Nematocida displodere]